MRARSALVIACAGLLVGCKTSEEHVVAKPVEVRSSEPAAPSTTATAVETPKPEPASFAKVSQALFLEEASTPDVARCQEAPNPTTCLLHLRYASDPGAERAARDFFATSGGIAGLEKASMFDGGWRGTIRIVPELPIGRYRRHLIDASHAVKRLDDLVGEIKERAKNPVRYRARDITFRFFRSVDRTTPSAFAEKWSIAYNVSGSLLGTSDGVRETLVHEIFHLNDEGRAANGENWSVGALGPTFDALVARCGTRASCLAPYAPASTMVRGGTYYAFQPGGGVHEYAAELAVRYFVETEAALGTRTGPKPKKPFKCGPKENALAWKMIVSEFFGGVDLTRSCGP